MFEITPRPVSRLRHQLRDYLEQLPEVCKDVLLSSKLTGEVTDAPFVQLGYDEIPASEIDRLLGYAGICSANSPIGLDGDFSPCLFGSIPASQILLFPLAGLEQHLTNEEPEIVALLRDLGTMDSFVEERGEAMTAIEYMTAGILTCIDFCEESQHGLAITW